MQATQNNELFKPRIARMDTNFDYVFDFVLLWEPKANGAKARSSGKINLPSSQAALMLRAAVVKRSSPPEGAKGNRRSFDFSPYGRRPSVRVGSEL
jgi:hypothetical protein